MKKGTYQSEETKKKISLSNKGKTKQGHIAWNKGLSRELQPHYNKKQTEETKRKISISHIGMKMTKEQSQAQSVRLKKAWEEGIFEREFSKERKQKMSLASKGKPKSEIHKQAIGKAHLGKKVSEQTRKILRENRLKRVFPNKNTTIEVKIQNFLKQLGIEFFTHQRIKEIAHRFQCDIFIPSMDMIIECDGNYWHKYPIGKEIDHIRTSELLQKGFKVLRLWESEIKVMDLNKFKERLL
jgi:very-short-patch-repair endonuclease